MLSSSKGLYGKHVGQKFLVDDAGLYLFRLSERGDVSCSEICPSDSEVERQLNVAEDDGEPQSSSKVLRTDKMTLGRQIYTEVDIYEKYNCERFTCFSFSFD